MGFFNGKSEGSKNTDGAGHIANPISTGEFAGEDQEGVDMGMQLKRLNEQLKKAREDTDNGKNPEIPIAELEEMIENLRAQMPFGGNK
ncbi:MAG: hypothetical protein A3A96_02240 [Candidatus Zambryskibacteria bacterium RIFCSPLOWO2_01_FULL_39_39]|uniref:Uncharacterized protein n=1 Tax=Candidatus Zambryskibacteria bacterium RIFCSPLOWO2_01_FULL_39_39 TaxID=1802758 RepID=A0A1G2TYK9_9BACT|nr:MAG: hypothetical protein UT00_C0014G0008 [Parcubacteria group bacterium GW2011_GWA1_38_7]OHA87264.1 MAG: hypothetical protein A2644_03025 [Candidatus Zambryskibacteria bacterium RIFCSPHIGHO2_01_FULL_39_63]OHA95201.1 MAG: hypothetical protein A3B88_03555 [Candidatus Zambryskibacteria bacterium RIFCSPHIGHO2_02_FULL_39_19]OHA98733.1 MAG: hypothetical protein A3F20_01645 [Candidatus Zambryskibacteria bacterium RIFCSPHIGHO2_12_FULL_39_21]OHB02253.1 MAG: hypothetical protein A3A96_02240 [Candidat